MQALFSALAEAEERQPYLQDSAVRRGTRGLAEYHLGDYGPAWNRCVPGRAGGLPLQTPVSLLLLLLLLSRSFLVITSPPKVGNSIGSSLSSYPRASSPLHEDCSVWHQVGQTSSPSLRPGAGCWTAWTPGWWSCSWILADRPPSLCSPCAPWTVMTSGPSPH